MGTVYHAGELITGQKAIKGLTEKLKANPIL